MIPSTVTQNQRSLTPLKSNAGLKVLIADDTALYRKILSMAIENIEDAEVIATASDGAIAVKKMQEKPADLVLLDVMMPNMDGVEALEKILKLYPDTAVVMLSGVTTADADITLRALELGALEFIPKPKGKSLDESMQILTHGLTRVIRILKTRKRVSIAKPAIGRSVKPAVETPKPVVARPLKPISATPILFNAANSLIVIGVSTGGPNALQKLLSMMPKSIGCPILIVQHMPAFFTASLAGSLHRKTGLKVKEAEDGETLSNDTYYIAPGGLHTLLEPTAALGQYRLKMDDGKPVNSCKPSVDVSFDSVAEKFKGQVLSIILTGMGEDGCKGVETIKSKGKSYSIAQDENSCVVYGMPKAIVEHGLADEVIPLDKIANRISELILKRKLA